MSLAHPTVDIFEGPCPNSAAQGCGACVSCRRRDQLHARLLEHFNSDAARQLRSGRLYLPSGNCECSTLPEMFNDLFHQAPSQPIQEQALSRWHTWVQKRGPSFTTERMRDLQAVTNILDDYFYQGTLGPYLKLRRVVSTKTLGTTTPFVSDSQVKNAPHNDARVTICISPPPGQKLVRRWAKEVRRIRNKQGRRPYALPRRKNVKRRVELIERMTTHTEKIGVLSTVLRELGHAVFLVFGCRACCMGDGGHGEAGRRLGEAMQRQANMVFTGMGTWHLL